MRLEFGVDDERAFLAARQQLSARFERWAARHRPGVEPWTLEPLLNLKWSYLDGHLGRWTTAELAELLLELFPRKVALPPEDVDVVVATTAAFVDFLAEERLLDAGGSTQAQLHAALDGIGHRFAGTMQDSSLFGPAKSLLGGMADEGVDLTDRTAVEAWMTAFNARPFEERAAIIPGAPAPPRLPTVTLAPAEQLAEAARGSTALRWLAGFAAWAGDGRPLTQKGNLKLADGKALVERLGTGDRVDETIGERTFATRSTAELATLDLVHRWARKAGFVKVRKGRISRTARAALLDGDPLEAWHLAFDALLSLGVVRHRYTGAHWFVPFWDTDLDDAVPGLLVALRALGDAPGRIEALGAAVWQEIDERYVLDGLTADQLEQQRDLVERNLRKVLERLEQLGAVAVLGVEVRSGRFGIEEPVGGEVTLTPLGVTAAQRLAEQAGLDAPAAGTLRDAPAAALLTFGAAAEAEAFEAEVAGWLDGRQPAAAAREVVSAMAAGRDDIAIIVGGFRVLDALDADVAADALDPWRADDRLGPFVQAWSARGAAATAAPIDEDPARLAVLLAAAAELDEASGAAALLARVGREDAQLAALDQLARVDGPSVPAALEAVAAGADKRVAKAARKALFRLRSR